MSGTDRIFQETARKTVRLACGSVLPIDLQLTLLQRRLQSFNFRQTKRAYDMILNEKRLGYDDHYGLVAAPSTALITIESGRFSS